MRSRERGPYFQLVRSYREGGQVKGTVYPRKNKNGKVTSYLGSYFTPDGKRRYVSAKTKTACREKIRRAMSEADQGSYSKQVSRASEDTWCAG